MIYVDRMGHLISSDSLEELHEFARRVGLKRRWFQDRPGHPHYDLTTDRAIKRAVAAGAHMVDPRELVRLLRSAPYQTRREKERWPN